MSANHPGCTTVRSWCAPVSLLGPWLRGRSLAYNNGLGATAFECANDFDCTTPQVLVCSCFAAGLLAEGTFAYEQKLRNFDIVMIDEAGQVGSCALENKALVVLCHARHV